MKVPITKVKFLMAYSYCEMKACKDKSEVVMSPCSQNPSLHQAATTDGEIAAGTWLICVFVA